MVLKRILIFCLLFCSSLSQAVQVSNLYSAVVNVPASLGDQALLNKAFSNAIDEVLARISGQQASLSSDLLNKAHTSAASWVAQHSVKDVASGGDAVKEVSVTFYKESIDGFLVEAGLPVWGSNRPSILVWLMEEQSGQRRMFGANQPSQVLSDFFDNAKKFGLPVYAPLVDETDRKALDIASSWGFFEEDIKRASTRYQTDVIAAVRLSEYRGAYVAESILLAPNQSSRLLSSTKPTRNAAMADILVQLSALLSERYAAVKMAVPNQMVVKVDGIRDYDAMTSLRKYLTSIDVVRDIQLNTINNGEVEFGISIDGSQEKFQNSVALSQVLISKPFAPVDMNAAQVAFYEYKGGN